MLTSIVVPLDGSRLAERALPYAEALARAHGGRLTLVRATLARTFPGVDPTEAQVSVMQQAEAELGAVADRLRAAGVAAETVVYYDAAVSAILDAVARRRADLIAMSTHGRTGLGRWVYGSVADQILRRAGLPVLLVPATVDRVWPDDRPLRILVPLDGSDLAEEALTLAARFAETAGADLLLVGIVEPLTVAAADVAPFQDLDPAPQLAEVERYLEGAAASWRSRDRTVDVTTAVGQPAATIAELARERGADLVVMATHGRGGLARLIMGSVATGVLQRTSVPLLLVRPAAMREPVVPPGVVADLEPVSAPVTITLTARELDLVQQGLEWLLKSSAREEHLAGPIRELITRLRQVEPAGAGQADRDTGR